MKVIRNFKYLGHEWNLNNNRIGISKANYEFFPKYKLMHYLGSGKWESCGYVNTKKEELQLARKYVNEILKYR